MQKLTMIFMVSVLSLAVMVPIFADDISTALNGTVTNSTNSSGNDSGNNSTIANNSTTNTTLTPEQIKTLTDTQSKLTALIATIESLKTTYGNNTKAKGLLNALDQFEKQANRLNSEITAFMQNPTAENSTITSSDINGKINSFVKRAAALEHKVAIKQRLLAKLGTKTVTKVKKVKTSKKTKKNKGH